jgi:hypothetical protein
MVEPVRKKYFFQELLTLAIQKIESLYCANKNNIKKPKQKQIDETLSRLKEIKDREYKDSILREIKKELINLSYKYRQVVLDTWKKYKNEKTKDVGAENFIDTFIEQTTPIESIFKKSKKDKLSKPAKTNNLLHVNQGSDFDSETESDNDI